MDTPFVTDRRGLIGLGAVAAATSLAGPARAQPGSAPAAAPAEVNETGAALDRWLDRPGARHRIVIDSTSPSGGMSGPGYAMNFVDTYQRAFGVPADQLAVLLLFRHGSTAFGYNDSIWSRYGAQFAKALKFGKEQSELAAKMNPLALRPQQGWNGEPPRSILEGMAHRGIFAGVCGVATKGVSHMLAGKDGDAAAIEADLIANLVPGARIVPAGIIAVARAQERGYAFALAD